MRRWFLVILGMLMGMSLYAGDVTPTMALQDVHAGMIGYGMTVFHGTKPERFEVKVIGITGEFLMVRISGGSNDDMGRPIIAQTHAFKGISGSPIYIEGKLMGALFQTYEAAQDSFGLVMPIKRMIDQNLRDDASVIRHLDTMLYPRISSQVLPQMQPGEAYATCGVWGDYKDCTLATITMRESEFVYAQGHQTSDMRSVAPGLIATPLYRAEVLAVLPSGRYSERVSSPVGEPIGTIFLNGQVGHIGILGRQPRGIPVVLSVDETLRSTFYVAYSAMSSEVLAYALMNQLQQYQELGQDVLADIDLTVQGLPVLHFQCSLIQYSLMNPRHPLRMLLDKLLISDKPRRLIESLRIKAHAVPMRDMYQVRALAGAPSGVQLKLQRDRDQREFVKWMPLQVVEETSLKSGADLRAEIMVSAPLYDIVDVLNAVPNCTSVYFYRATVRVRAQGFLGEPYPADWIGEVRNVFQVVQEVKESESYLNVEVGLSVQPRVSKIQ